MKFRALSLAMLIGALGACPALWSRPAFGVYEGPGTGGTARIPGLTQWLGRAPDRALDFFANDTWPSLESDAAWTCYSWSPPATGAVVPAMTFSVPLTVNGTSLADVAAGLHDSSFLSVARSLVTYNWGHSVVRLGWEFNGGWMPWAADQNPAAYVAAYRHVVALMRSVPGAEFTFDWCTSWGPNSTAPDSVYPGDDVVDIIGMDVYNRYYSPADSNPQNRWQMFLTAPYGLNWLVSFAALHGKSISIPEWGTGEWTVNDGGVGGGDDSLFVTSMTAFMESNSALYSDYWDINASGYNSEVSDGEHALAGTALRASFGSGAASVVPGIPVPGPIPYVGPADASTTSTVSFSCSAPYTGGAATSYVILYRVSGSGSWKEYGSVTWIGWQTLWGVSPGTSYDICVYALNAGGNGPDSSIFTVSSQSTWAPPEPAPGQIPWIGVGQAPTATSISINFAPPNDGGIATSYVILRRITGQSAWVKAETVTWTGWQTVAGLAPGTSYQFEVYASNSAGSGSPSSVLTLSTLSN